MAHTFTGPKLEGLIGKFGQVPLSDICAFVELPDGKVLSGTETGTVLVWDGGLIKCQLRRLGGLPCHDGMIEFLQLDGKANEMLTAGADGCVRFWSLQWLDAADDGDEKTVCEVNPLRELQVDEKCSIKGIIVSDDHWLIQDEYGALWKVHVPSFEAEKVLEFHAGVITGLSVSPNNHFLATSGSDCSVRLFDFKKKQQVYARWFASGATSILWPSKTVDTQCRTVVAGFSDGVIRILSKGTRQWKLIHVQKPHTMDVTALRYTFDGDLLATSSLDSTVFFFHSSNGYKPLGFIKAPGPVTCVDWSPSGSNLLLGCSNGKILEIARPGYEVDSKITFELILPVKLYTFSLPEVKELPQKAPESSETNENNSLIRDEGTEEEKLSQEKEVEESNKVQSELPGVDGNNEVNVQTQIHDQPREENNEVQPTRKSQTSEVSSQESNVSQFPTQDGTVVNQNSEKSTKQVDFGEVSSLAGQNTSQETSRRSVCEIAQEAVNYAVRALLYTNSNLNTFYVALETGECSRTSIRMPY